MESVNFNIVSGTDKEYYLAFEATRKDGVVAFEAATFGQIGEQSPDQLAEDAAFQEILECGTKVFPTISFKCSRKCAVSIKRQHDLQTSFDKVSVSPEGNTDPLQFAKCVASVQKHFGRSTLNDIAYLLGPATRQHFEAREVALTRLEKMAAVLLEEMEQARKRREEEFRQKETELKESYRPKRQTSTHCATNAMRTLRSRPLIWRSDARNLMTGLRNTLVASTIRISRINLRAGTSHFE
jgi:hypothetical protein